MKNIKLVNDFVLPEKWFVLYSNREEFDAINKHFNKEWFYINRPNAHGYHNTVSSNNWVNYSDTNVNSLKKQGFKEITFKQFKKYVLKKNTDDECFKKVYTIKDLSEGKVAVSNDGTKEELKAVLKAAFPEAFCFCEYLESYKVCCKNPQNSKEWVWDAKERIDLPTQSVKEFYKQLNPFKVGDEVVGKNYSITAVNGFTYDIFDEAYIRIVGEIKDDKIRLKGDDALWFYAKDFKLNKQLKTEKMDNRFPFKLSVVDAQRIIDISCDSWKNELVEKWSREILVHKLVLVSEDFYRNMRKACTGPQNKLFDEIFGSDEEQFKVGDWVVWNDGYVGRINKACPFYPGCWNIRVDKSNEGLYTSCSEEHLRKATPEEIAKAQCPYEDGELCFVADDIDSFEGKIWKLRYATGEVNQFGKPLFYRDQKKNTNSCYLDWDYHKSAKGIELPKD